MFDPASCAGSGMGEHDARGLTYGLGADPFLAGINPFKILAAPFKAGAKVVNFGVKTAVRVAPRAAVGFLTAGPAGAIAGGASAFLPVGRDEVLGSPAFAQTSFTGTPAGPAQVPYRTLATAQPGNPYAPTNQQYYSAPRPAPNYQDQLKNVANLLKDELLATGGRLVAATPAGQRGIREKVGGDIGRYLLPISLGLGGLLLVTAMVRR